MPVLMIAEIPNLTEDVYAGSKDQWMPLLRVAKGFISHVGGPSPTGGWRVIEVWESEADGQAWFDNNIKPILPPDVVPISTFYPLHSALTK